MIPSDPSLRAEGLRVDEWSIVRFDGREEAITMRLESSAAFERAALIVPLPAEADFALGDDAVFDEMAERTAPRVERRTRHTLFGSDDDGAQPDGGGARATAGVEVVGSEDLGPLRVVTLRGDDGLLVKTWLQDHGFEPPEGIERAAQPYLDKGWVLAAVRLRSAGAGEVRRLQPLVMRFPAEQAVYPMMGGEARVDVVAPQPVAVRGRPDEERVFAGPMPDGRYVTTFEVTDDAEFVAAERRDFRQVRYVYEEVDVTGRVLAATAGVLALVAAAIVLLVRRRRATS
jgi:hypothetical protein